MKQRLQVHEHRVLAGRDHVLVMEVRGLERVQQRDVAAQPFVEPVHRISRLALRG